MKHSFFHQGKERELLKHSDVIRALRAGTMTEDEARLKPWYLRLTVGKDRMTFKFTEQAPKDAERAAKAKINDTTTDKFKLFLASEAKAKSVTVGELWEEWNKLDCPRHQAEFRTAAQIKTIRRFLGYALPWWKDKPIETITPSMHGDYAASRKHALRSVDMELCFLSCLCRWAVQLNRIKTNPFLTRLKFSRVKNQCHKFMPKSDEQFHSVLAWFFDSGKPEYIITGAHFAFQGLTGLRPNEPRHLLRVPPLEKTPGDVSSLVPGTMFKDRKGQLRMKIARLKNGQNLVIILHPVLQEFLSAWRAWMARNATDEKFLFPISANPTRINDLLDKCCAKLEIPSLHPHGFRAYYVRVLRADEMDNAAIANKLGQTSGGKLISTTYGDPQDMQGGALFDWLPEDSAPAWSLLANQPKTTKTTTATATLTTK